MTMNTPTIVVYSSPTWLVEMAPHTDPINTLLNLSMRCTLHTFRTDVALNHRARRMNQTIKGVTP